MAEQVAAHQVGSQDGTVEGEGDLQDAPGDGMRRALENELTGRRSDLQALEDRLDRELDGLE